MSRGLASTRRRGHTQAVLLVAGAEVLALTSAWPHLAGSAFVAPAGGEVVALQATRGWASAKPFPTSSAGVAAPNASVLGGGAMLTAALMCLAALRAYSTSRRSQTASKARISMCAMQLAAFEAPTMAPPGAPNATPAALHELLSFEEAEIRELQLPTALPRAMLIAMAPALLPSAFVAPWVAPAAAPSATPRRRFSAARRVAGERKASSRGAAASRVSRAAAAATADRRSIGARLQQRPAFSAVASAPASFDASRIRLKIQIGLRGGAIFRSEAGRGAKASSCDALNVTGDSILANELGQREFSE
mmetsp:Transcript_70340/g.201550  ORF Transcript_70340/g.201550 Transcript_70340/m.201550 type:complete len:306 (+) Transcript_70340:70-987(+)